MKKKSKTKIRVLLAAAAVLLCVLAGLFYGSASIAPCKVLRIVASRLGLSPLPADISALEVSILCRIRLPRLVMSLLCGAALAVSGAVMQSLLRNPLASSYTLGVSSGASLAAAPVIISGWTLPLLPSLTLPLCGFVGGVFSVAAALALALRFDSRLENNTVILTGMVLSLFVNALLTIVMAFSGESLKQLIFWQMGSFEGQSRQNCVIMAALLLLLLPLLLRRSRELDLLCFGDEMALSAGVELRRVKLLLLIAATLLAGAAVSFVGVIGFVDLIAPHIVRRAFGSNHRLLLPLSALCGAGLMVLADLLARVAAHPHELPVGAVTALIGAPFFVYVYFRRRREVI